MIREFGMRVVAVSIVKDEADVIEAFVRHTAAVVDHHIVFDHRSGDATPFILERLRLEGFRLTVLQDSRMEFMQSARTTALCRLAIARHTADWLLPLDADEFIQAESPAAVRAALAARDGASPVALELVNYGPHPDDDPAEANPVLRMRHRSPRVQTHKVAVPARLLSDPSAAVQDGNHALVCRGASAVPDAELGPPLAHFPIRWGGQVAVKVFTHELQRLATCGALGGGNHYSELLEQLIANPRRFLAKPDTVGASGPPAPAAYWGGPLLYLPPEAGDWERIVAGVLPLAKQLAEKHGSLWKQLEGGKRRWFQRARDAVKRRLNPTEPVFDFREPLSPADSRDPCLLAGELSLLRNQTDGKLVRLAVRVRNTGRCIWRTSGEGAVQIGIMACGPGGEVLNRDFARIAIPTPMWPGESATLSGECSRPMNGSQLRLDLLAERVAWFECPGSAIPCS